LALLALALGTVTLLLVAVGLVLTVAALVGLITRTRLLGPLLEVLTGLGGQCHPDESQNDEETGDCQQTCKPPSTTHRCHHPIMVKKPGEWLAPAGNRATIAAIGTPTGGV
jgi:hypothetical protein